MWEEELEIKESSATGEERHETICHKKPKYHEGKGNDCAGLGMDGQMVNTSITGNCLGFFKVLSLIQNGR